MGMTLAGCASYRLEREPLERPHDFVPTKLAFVATITATTTGTSWGRTFGPLDPAELHEVRELVREAIVDTDVFRLCDVSEFDADVSLTIDVRRICAEDPWALVNYAFLCAFPGRQREWFVVRCDIDRKKGADRSHSRIGVLTVWHWLPAAPISLFLDHRSQRRELLSTLVREVLLAHAREGL